MNLCFKGKNMTYKMVQNLVQLDGQIKKSTFLPTPIRDFGLNSYQKGLNCRNFLIHCPIMLHLFITPFWLLKSQFSPFLEFLSLF